MAVSLFNIVQHFADDNKLIKRGENAVNSGHVASFTFDSSVGIVKAKVHASMKNKQYGVQIWFSTDYNIEQTACECPRGQANCHHIAAALLYCNKNVSSTDRICQWTQRKAQPSTQTVDDMYPPKPYVAVQCSVGGEAYRHQFHALLKQKMRFCPMTWYLAPEPAPTVLPVETVEQLLVKPSVVTASDPVQAMMKALAVSPEQATAVEEATRGQAENTLWSIYRKGRITASNVGSVLKCIHSGRAPSASLMKTLIGDYDLSTIRAVQWGQNHESVAREFYETLMEVTVQPCWLYLFENGVVGGSPDGRVSKEKIIEIKCPYSAAQKSVTELMSEKKFYVQRDANGVLALNLSDPLGFKYFHQVQTNMFLTGACQCDFIVWSPSETVVFVIDRDHSWPTNVPLLTQFYQKRFLPALLNGVQTV